MNADVWNTHLAANTSALPNDSELLQETNIKRVGLEHLRQIARLMLYGRDKWKRHAPPDYLANQPWQLTCY